MALHKLFLVASAILLRTCESSVSFPAFDTASLGNLALGTGHYFSVPGASCSDNSPFYVGLYLVDKGDGTPVTENLTIEFAGGGACFDPKSCAEGDEAEGPGFIRNLAFVPEFAALDRSCGITTFGLDNYCVPENPLRRHSMVYIPYCTGDLHGGVRKFTYNKDTGDSFDIHHVGANNTVLILDWVASLFTDPKHIVVFGGSAGALGAMIWAPNMAERWPGADVRVFADSGFHVPAGAEATRAFFNREYGASVWLLNNELTAMDDLAFNENYTDFVVEALKKYNGRLVLGFFSCDLDSAADDWWAYITQLYGIPTTDRLAATWDMLESFDATAPAGTVHSYMLPGVCHHAGLGDIFNLYVEPGKPTLVSWLSDLFFSDHSTSSNVWCSRTGGSSACSWRDFPTDADAFAAARTVIQAGITPCQEDCCWLSLENVGSFAAVFLAGLSAARNNPALAAFCGNCTALETCPIAQCIAWGPGCASLRQPAGLKFFDLVCKEALPAVSVAGAFATAAAADGCCPTGCDSPSEKCPDGVHKSCAHDGAPSPSPSPGAGSEDDASQQSFTFVAVCGCLLLNIFLGSP